MGIEKIAEALAFSKINLIFANKQDNMTTQTATSTLGKSQFSNLQLQLLKLYSDGVSDEDLKAIQRMIAKYFAEKASKEAQEVWDEKGYSAVQILE